MAIDPYAALQSINNFGRAIAGRDPNSFGAKLGGSTDEIIKGLMIQQELEKQRKAQEEAEKGSIFGQIGSVVGGIAGAAIPGIGPIVGPAIGSALGGAAGTAIGGGSPSLQSVGLDALSGAVKGFTAPEIGVAAPVQPAGAPAVAPGGAQTLQQGLQTQKMAGVEQAMNSYGVGNGVQPQVQVQPLAPVQQAAPLVQQDLTQQLLPAAAVGLAAPAAVGFVQDALNPVQPQSPAPGATAQQAQNPLGGPVAQARPAPNAFPNLTAASPFLGQWANNFRAGLMSPQANLVEQATGQIGIANPITASTGLEALLGQAQNYLFNDARSRPATAPRYGLGPQDVAQIEQTLQSEQQLRQQAQAEQDRIGVANRELSLRQQGLGLEQQRLNQANDPYSVNGDYIVNKRTGQVERLGPVGIKTVHKIPIEGGLEKSIVELTDGTFHEYTPDFIRDMEIKRAQELNNPSSRFNTTTMQEQGAEKRSIRSEQGSQTRFNQGQADKISMFNADQSNQQSRFAAGQAGQDRRAFAGNLLQAAEGQANRDNRMEIAQLNANNQRAVAALQQGATKAESQSKIFAGAQTAVGKASTQAEDFIKTNYPNTFTTNRYTGQTTFNIAGNPEAARHYPILVYGNLAPGILSGAIPADVASPLLQQVLDVVTEMKDGKPVNAGDFGIKKTDFGATVDVSPTIQLVIPDDTSQPIALLDLSSDKMIPLSPAGATQ